MKKAISIFLSIAMITISVFTPVSMNASATTVNLINNGNFEASTGIAANAYGLGLPDGCTIRGVSASAPYAAITTASTEFNQWFRATWGNSVWNDSIVTEGTNRVGKIAQTLFQGVTVGAGKTYQLSFRARSGPMIAGTLTKTIQVQLCDSTTSGVAGAIEANKFLMATGSISGTILDPTGNPAAGQITANTETYAKWINMPVYESTDYYTYTMKFTVGPNFNAADKYTLKIGTNANYSSQYYYAYLDDIALYELSTTTFDAQGGSTVTPKTLPVGTEVASPTTTKTGFIFDGWYTAPTGGTLVTFPYTTVSGGATLYAHWATVPISTITYDSNGGSAVPPVTVNNDTAISAPTAPILLGYRFDGWFTDPTAGTQISFPYTVNGDAMFYAHWTNVGTYTVNYDAQGGSAVSPQTVTNYESIATSPATTQPGFRFDGWFTDATDGTQVTFPYAGTADITLYAHWTVVYSVSATAAVGGTASVTKSVATTGETVTFTCTTSYPYTFNGWYKDGVLYNSNTEFSEAINANTTYQARFAAPTGQQVVNGDFETPTGYTQDSIDSRFPSPLYGTPADWNSAAKYQRWFRASVGNATIYDAIIPDPENASNHIAKVMQTAMTGVTVSSDTLAYEIKFKAKSDYAYQKFSVGFADLTNAVTNSVHPTAFPITSIVKGTKTYVSGGAPVTEEINPYDAASTGIIMSLATDQWVSYDFIVTLGAPLVPGALTALRFGCTDYQSGISYYLDDVTLTAQNSFPEKLASLDADSNIGKVVNGGSDATVTEIATPAGAPAELGTSVYSVTTNSDFQAVWADAPMYLKAGKQYDLSCWFKVDDTHTILTTETEMYKYMTFFLKTAVGGTTTIPTSGGKLLTSLTREPAGGQKVITHPTETTSFMLNSTAVKDANGAAIWQKITVSFTPSADTTAVFGIRPNAAGTVYVDKIRVTSADTAVTDIQAALTAVGTAIRTNGTQALRFKTSIDKSLIGTSYLGNYELIEYGSVAIKTAYLNGEELKYGSYTQADGQTVKNAVKGAAYIKGLCNIKYAESDTAIQYTAALTGISQANYNTSYSVRAYAIFARADGTTFTVYDDVTRDATIYNIATLAYNSPGDNEGYAESPAVRAYLNDNIISKADFETYPGDGFKLI